MIAARQEATATLLPDGTVLIAGGVDSIGPGQRRSTIHPSGPSVQPARWQSRGPGTLRRHYETVAGGSISGSNPVRPSATVLLYSPERDTLIMIGALFVGRNGPTGTLLSDGTVLIAGGAAAGFVSSAVAEIVDLRPRSRVARH